MSVVLAVQLPVAVHFGGHLLDGALHEQHDLGPEFGAGVDGIRRHGYRESAAGKAFQRPWADFDAGLLDHFTVIFRESGFERRGDHPGRFVELGAALVHVLPKPLVFQARQSASHAEDGAAIAVVIEQRDFFGHAQRIVPRQDHRASTQLDATGTAGHVAQKLGDIRTHGVVGEMVFDAPDGIETEWLGQFGELELGGIDLGIAEVAGVLEQHLYSAFHRGSPVVVPPGDARLGKIFRRVS